MLRYILKRILLYIPTLLIVCVAIFYLSRQSPHDIVDHLLENEGLAEFDTDRANYEKEYVRKAKEIRLDRPIFYWQIVPKNYPRNIHELIWKEDIALGRDLLKKGYEWEFIKEYNSEIKRYKLSADVKSLPKDLSDLAAVKLHLTQTDQSPGLQSILNSFKDSKDKLYFPRFDFHGFDNQFHYWMSNMLMGEFGNSNLDGRSVMTKLKKALPWTLFISIFALLLTVIISIPLGVFLSTRKNKFSDRLGSLLSFGIYSIPTFWLATILVVFFTNSNYSSYLNIFPSIGVDINSIGKTNLSYMMSNWTKMILPIFCLSFHALSYMAMQTRSSMQNQLSKNYILTSKAKGMLVKNIHWKHALKNALIPIVTVIMAALPSLVAGSVIMEVIFNIPGMGRLVYDSILGSDWNVVYAVVIIIAFLTWLSYLLGDIIYALINPKIDFQS